MKIRKKMDETFAIFWSTLTMIFQTSPITLCSKSCAFETKYVVFATPVSQNQICQAICFILNSLSAQMNILNTKFLRNTMKSFKLFGWFHLECWGVINEEEEENHETTTLITPCVSHEYLSTMTTSPLHGHLSTITSTTTTAYPINNFMWMYQRLTFLHHMIRTDLNS